MRGVIGIGTVVNAAAIVAGTVPGFLFGRLIPERVRKTVMAALGLTVFFLGMQMALDPRVDGAKLLYAGPLPYHPNPLIVIGGLLIAAIGLDAAGIKRLPVGNMLPGVFVAAILAFYLG